MDLTYFLAQVVIFSAPELYYRVRRRSDTQFSVWVFGWMVGYEFPTPTYVEFIYAVMGEIIAIKYLHLIIVL